MSRSSSRLKFKVKFEDQSQFLSSRSSLKFKVKVQGQG